MTVDPIGFYNRRYRVSSGELNDHQLARLAPILRYVGTVGRRPGLRLLDVGCGIGWLAERLARFGDVWGVDISEEAVRRARQRVPGGIFEARDFVADPIPWEPFDIVVCSEVLEHVQDQEAGLAQLAALVKPGGSLVLTTPNLDRASPADFSEDLLQPVENWLSRTELRRLLAGSFRVRDTTTAYLEHSCRGLYHLINSVKLARALALARVDRLWRRGWESSGFGLYQVVLATRREDA